MLIVWRVHSIYIRRRGFWELQCFEFIESIDNVTFIHNSSVRFPVILSTAYFSFLCLRYILRNEHLFNINWISFLRSCMWLVHKSLTVLCYAIGFNAGFFCYAHTMADIAITILCWCTYYSSDAICKSITFSKCTGNA